MKDIQEKTVVHVNGWAMVNNLLVALVSETEMHPIVNTGTLYT
jgi:hypothetical protein